MAHRAPQSPLLRYTLPIVAVGGVVAVRSALQTATGAETRFLLFFAAVMVSAWYGGLGPGLLASVLAAAASSFFFIDPVYSLWVAHPADRLRLWMFFAEAVFVSILGGRMRGAQDRAERNYQQARHLQEELVRVGDAERQRVGHDLHDGVGQLLTGTALMSRALCDKLTARGAPEVEDARRVVDLVNDSIAQTRGIAQGLAQVDLGSLGLRQALDDLAAHTARVMGVQCHCAAADVPGMTENVGIHLYRTAQEAISNAVRHGKARTIWIDLAVTRGGREVALSVANDGAPFDPRPPKPGMGLRIMEHRAKIIGGRLRIDRAPDGRMRVNVTVPAVNPSAPGAGATTTVTP